MYSPEKAYDGDVNTYYLYCYWCSTYVGVKLVQGLQVMPSTMRYHMRITANNGNYNPVFAPIYFQGSADGGITWQTIGTDRDIRSGWNNVPVTTTGW